MILRLNTFAAKQAGAIQLVVISVGCMLMSSPVVAQQQDGTSISDVVVGLEGNYRAGHFTQIRVTVDSPDAKTNVRLEIALPDGEGVRTLNVTEGLTLSAGSNQLAALAKFGRVNADLQVRLHDGVGDLLAEKTIAAAELPAAALGSQNLVLTLGPDIGVESAIYLRLEKNEQETIHGHITNAESLPENWLGYCGVSLIVLTGSDASIAFRMSTKQLDALERWVRMGGRLIFSSGRDAERSLGANGPLARFAPGSFDRVQMQRKTSSIENYAGKTTRSLDSFIPEGELSFRIPMTSLKDVIGTVVVAEGIGGERTALVIRSSHGFGHVIFMAVDLDQAPLSEWKDGRRRILGKLIDLALGETKRDDSDNQYSKLTQIGFNDLTGQLRSSLDQFGGVMMVPFSWIAILVGLYIVLIGPIDYLLLRNWRRRFSLTWITFPLLVLAGCGLAYGLTQYWKGHALRLNQVDIVDIDSESGLLRGTSWGHVFSPASQKYDLTLASTESFLPVAEPKGQISGWQGLPGRSFGGMNTSRLSQTSESYEIIADLSDESNQSIRIAGMPIDIYSSRSLSGLVWGQVDLPLSEPFVSDADNQLAGIVRNPLPVALRDCKLCYGRWVYSVPTLPAGGEYEIDRSSTAKTIDGMLTKTQVDKDYKDRSQAWDRRTFDLNRILEIMMFHKAAGGTKYTQLLHRFQSEIDFTDHLTQGRALLVGKTAESPTTMLASDEVEANTTTYVRILLPVKPRSH